MVIHTHPASANGGAIGALIAQGDMASKTTKYNNELRPIKADLAGISLQKTVSALQNAGYVTNVINVRGVDDREFLETYPSTTADAILDYTIHPKQAAAGANTNYIPTLGANVRLVDTKTKAILYEEHMISGLWLNSFEDKIVSFPSNSGYANIDELVAHAKESQDGLIEGIDKVTNRIAVDLKK